MADSDAVDRDDEEGHRLHDMLVQEVSVVDRAANKRRFLILKRSDDMADDRGNEITKDEDGNLTAAGAKPEEDKDKDKEKDKADKQALTIPAPVKETVSSALAEAMNRLATVQNQVKGAKTTEERLDAPLPTAVGDEVVKIRQILRSIGEKYPSPRAKAEDDAGDTAADIEKAGRRISGARLTKLRGAVEALQALIKDFAGEEDVKKGDSPPPPDDAVTKRLTQLSEIVEKQAGILSGLMQTHQDPAAIPVEGGDQKTADEKPAWPFNINAPDKDTW